MRFISDFFLILQHKKNQTMKKITLLFSLIMMISLTACSNNGEKNQTATKTAGKPADGQVMHLNAEQFRKLVWDYQKNPNEWTYQGDLPCIIDFYADWCRPCKIIAPILEELAVEYKGKIRVYKINTEVEKELASVFNIRSIPAVLFCPREGKPQMSVGALPKPTFVQAINEVLQVK